MNKEITESFFFRHNPDPMWVFDVETLKFLDVNHVALRRYGYSLSEFLAMGIENIKPPEDIEPLHKVLKKPFEAGEVIVTRHRLKSGQIIHVSIRHYPVIYQSRAAMIVAACDVSQLIALQAENAHLLAREREVRQEAESAARYFQSLFETIPGKFLVLTPEHYEIVAVSDAYLEVTMRVRDDIKGRLLFDAFPAAPDDHDAKGVSRLRASLDRARSSGLADVMAVQLYPIPRPSENGGGFEDRYWSSVNTPIKGPDGKVAYIVHRVEDVTELVQCAGISGEKADEGNDVNGLLAIDIALRSQELKEAQQRSELLSHQMATALESMSDAFFTLNSEWRFSYMNAQAEAVLARTRSDLLGKVLWHEFPAALGTRFETEYKRAMSLQSTVRFVEFYAPLGKWFEFNAYPAPDSLAVYFRDITESRQRDEQLIQAQKMEVLGQLTGGIAHDFNNLLTVIMGNTELLAQQLHNSPALKDLAKMAAEAAGKGAELTSRLLAFARRQTLSPRVLDANRLLADMEPLLKRALTENIAIISRQTAGLWTIEADATQLESAILNIAINARDAMPHGGEFTITTRNLTVTSHDATPKSLAAGDYVVITLSDTGSGIPADLIHKVFEPFFTTKDTGKGSGLGLSMVFGFVKQSLGFIDITSSAEQGTTLSLYFPRVKHEEISLKTDSVLPAQVRGGTEHILLVEDNYLVLQYVSGQLRALGYRVTVAGSGAEALEVVEKHSDIDLLLTDIIMPGGISGIDLANAVQLRRPGISVLYTSGFTDGNLEIEGRLPHGVELLTKPYKRNDLAIKVRTVLEKVQ